ncbi:SAM-dependent methyltransferase [Kribbella sandramycini]|uniref:SAM-dependent methyltransferase n=1 Tax=Kribbella sandramycini TaxID=60450 RepID=A0A7Y4L444_9ACTN|nr:SAM-dependent methyltransferase [Kribbella sandramycini]MBB6566243.1 SAM-dependent methyltransferase [Kribbella sandramycini]NOL43092.1 SAM-dependent methyltransferase [Kribbella sandramycini]
MADEQVPDTPPYPGFDMTRPSIARTYDYLLGGKDNFAVDRAFGDRFVHELPGSPVIATDNRAALIRAVREIVATTGIRQFVDLGSGLPTADNVHQVAQRYAPETKVVYVDNDPIVLAHGQALLAENDHTTVIQADLREPKAIYDHEGTRRLISFDEPVAVIFSAILHHVNDDEDPHGLFRFWADRIVPGSHVFVSHFRSENDPRSAEIEAVLQGSLGRGRWRTEAEIRALFGDDFTILDPGLVPAARWRNPEPPDELGDYQRLIAAVLAVKK